MPPWQDEYLRPLPRAVDLREAPPAWLIGCDSVASDPRNEILLMGNSDNYPKMAMVWCFLKKDT